MQPSLFTDRLVLRPFTVEDAPAVQRLAGEFLVADTTAAIPHPYEDGMAEAWIGTHAADPEKGAEIVWAIVIAARDEVVGAIGLVVDAADSRGELGYWIGHPYWNSGYCTEAAQAVIAYAFADLNIHKVSARHLARNPASGRVMEKCGMIREGYLKEHVRRWGMAEDLVLYGILNTRGPFPQRL